jgi:hypothetical protein
MTLAVDTHPACLDHDTGPGHAEHPGRLSAVIFALAALAHAVRLYRHWPLQLGPVVIPPEASWIGLAVAVPLCIWGLRAARR